MLVSLATKDPEGARVAILDYGKLLGYPDRHFGVVKLKGGEAGWYDKLATTQPLWLGVAWACIESECSDSSKAAQPHGKQKEENVPTLQWTESSSIAAGNYSAIITEITEEDGQFGPQLRFQFVCLDAEGNETDDEIRAWCSQKWGPKTKLYEWSKAILRGKCPGPGQPMDTDKLLRKKCDIVVEEVPTQGGLPKTKVTGVYPYKTMTAIDDDPEDN